MSKIVHDCPYCNNKNMTFNVLSTREDHFNRKIQYALTRCDNCDKEVTFSKDTSYRQNITKIVGLDLNSFYRCPNHVPDKITKVFNEAAECYKHNCFIASLTMLRTSLDKTTKDLLKEEKDQNKTLFQRVEILFNQGLIRPFVKQLASEIRLEGNDATHDGYADRNNLEATFEFTTFLLQELYTDKKEIEIVQERRAKRKKQGTEK